MEFIFFYLRGVSFHIRYTCVICSLYNRYLRTDYCILICPVELQHSFMYRTPGSNPGHQFSLPSYTVTSQTYQRRHPRLCDDIHMCVTSLTVVFREVSVGWLQPSHVSTPCITAITSPVNTNGPEK